MRAGNGNAQLETHQLGQHDRARHHRHARRLCRNHFRVIGFHGAGGDNHIGPGNVCRDVADHDFRAQRFQSFYHRRFGEIRSTHVVIKIDQHLGDTGHAGSADADEVKMFDFMLHAASSALAGVCASKRDRPEHGPKAVRALSAMK